MRHLFALLVSTILAPLAVASDVVLESSPLAPGGILTLTVRGLPAHETVWLLRAAGQDIQYCEPPTIGPCLVLASPASLMEQREVDASGRAVFQAQLPERMRVEQLAFQVTSAGHHTYASNIVVLQRTTATETTSTAPASENDPLARNQNAE